MDIGAVNPPSHDGDVAAINVNHHHSIGSLNDSHSNNFDEVQLDQYSGKDLDIIKEVAPEQAVTTSTSTSIPESAPSLARVATTSSAAAVVESGDNNDNDHHQQLPNVEEYKATMGIVNKKSIFYDLLERFKFCIAIFVIMFIIILIATIIGTNNKKNNNTDSAQSAPSSNSNIASSNDILRLNEAIGIIRTAQYSTDESLIYDMNDKNSWTAQVRAAYWLANNDPNLTTIEPSFDFMNRYILAVLFYMTNGDDNWKNVGNQNIDFDNNNGGGWTDRLNFLSISNVCDWNKRYISKTGDDDSPQQIIGILCNNEYEIIRIWIPNNNLFGRLPVELSMLGMLEELNFYNNMLFGQIPKEYKQLQRMNTIILYQNQIQDNFPDWFGYLPLLRVLNLGKNDIFGTLPMSLQTVERLEVLNCDSCLLYGTIESALSRGSSLTAIQLGNNKLNGTISDEIFSTWLNLIELDLSSNLMTGKLPFGLMMTHPELLIIDLHDNNFTGPIIDIAFKDNPLLFELSKLRLLSLAGNTLTGSIDGWIGYLKELRHLDFSFNPLNGIIPTEIGLLTELRYLFLAMNDKYIEGPIPTEIGLLTQLMDVSFQKSNRNSTIPTEFGKINSLVLLDLQKNKLSGIIPNELGNISSINFLLLYDNQLNASYIPEGLITDGLDTLTLNGNNNIITSVPSMICNSATKIRTININYDKLNDISKNDCNCCNQCDNVTTNTNPDIWKCSDFYFGNMDPSAEYNYARTFYLLNEEDQLIPIDNNYNIAIDDIPLYGANVTSSMWNNNNNNSDETILNYQQNMFGNTIIMNNLTNALNNGISKPWDEMNQDLNYTDDYLKSYIESYLDEDTYNDEYIDDKYKVDDQYEQKYFGDGGFIGDFVYDDDENKYDDNQYGDYNEDGLDHVYNDENEEKHFIDVQINDDNDWLDDDNST